MVLILIFFACKNKYPHFDKEIHYGPFTIRASVSSSRQFNINTGSHIQTDVAYTIYYKEKPVEFPDGLQSNTGLAYLWNVFVLSNAPVPSLVAGSQNLYLIYERNDRLVVEPLLLQSHDFASLQLLDYNSGQPGPFQEVYARLTADSIDRLNTLEGGKYLMVGEKVVLEINTFKKWDFHVNHEDIDNYSFPSPHGALAFSPDQKSIVFLGNFQSWNAPDEALPETETALVVYHFQEDSGYTVTFDATETRLLHIHEVTLDWFNQFFEWTKAENGYRLRRKILDTLPPWTGRYDNNSNFYTLYPVNSGMLPVFQQFILDQMGWTPQQLVKDTYHEYTGRCLDFESGGIQLSLQFKEDEQTLNFSKNLTAQDKEEYRTLIKKMADGFDTQLKSGMHQEHFGRILSQTKKIKGLYK